MLVELEAGTICQGVEVLGRHVLASTLYGEGEAFIFQRDNAPCHKSRQLFI